MNSSESQAPSGLSSGTVTSESGETSRTQASHESTASPPSERLSVASSFSPKKMIKFLLEDDLALLTAVVGAKDQHPFLQPFTGVCWTRIAAAVIAACPRTAGLSGRACKERAERMVKQYTAGENWKARQ